MESLGPKGYQDNALRAFTAKFDTRGKRILEVGGSNLPRDYVFDLAQPAQWVCVDPIDTDTLAAMNAGTAEPYLDHLRAVGVARLGDTAMLEQPYAILAEPMEDCFGALPPTFDLVFSVACFEHIHRLDAALASIQAALRPGGTMWSQFSPIWSSIEGHHCSWIPHGRLPEAAAAGTGLIPPFGHLTHSETELRALLEGSYSPADLDWAIHSIFHHDYINRLFFDDYVAILGRAPFAETDLRGIWPVEIDAAIKAVLAAKYPDRTGFEFQGIEITAVQRPS